MSENTKKDYESRVAARKRAEKFYPDELTKREFNQHCKNTGEVKSQLVITLVRSFLKAKKDTGCYPTVITIIP